MIFKIFFKKEVYILVDFEKCWKMRHFSLRSASIQLRTSLGKGDGSWPEPAAGCPSSPKTGPFSAVSTPIVMRNSAFFNIFQDLQEFTLFSWKIFENHQHLVILLKFSENSGDFCESSRIFSKIFIIFWKKCENRVDLEKVLTLKNAPSLAIGGTNFAKIWLKFWQTVDRILIKF